MFNNCFQKKCCPVISTECCPVDPVYEMPIEKCVQKDYVHEVTHDW